METIRRFIKDCLTGRDGESYDGGRALWILGALSFIAFSAYAVFKSGTFDPLNWGAGYGSLLGGGGAAIKLKAGTEPCQGQEPQ